MSGIETGTFHIWSTYLLVAAAIAAFSVDRIRIEISSLFILISLLLLFELVPLRGSSGEKLLDTAQLLSGFSNPSLVAVLALLVLGNGLWRTGALDWALKLLFQRAGGRPAFALGICFAVVFSVSPFMNNTPVVVIFIPILETIAKRFSLSPSKVMMPLSFVAILAGMTTVVGSSTNLLVSGTLVEMGASPLGFFEFLIPGLVLAGTGIVYLLLLGPFLLPTRTSPVLRFMTGNHRRFITQLTVGNEPRLVGSKVRFNLLGISGARLLLAQRGEQRFVPPYLDMKVLRGDTLIVLATHDALAEAQTKFPQLMFSASGARDLPSNNRERLEFLASSQIVAEIMIAPGSALAGLSLSEADFRAKYGCLVLGVEQHSRVTRHLTGRALQEGDVLVVQGDREIIERLRQSPGVVMLDGTARPLPAAGAAKISGCIFLGVILIASTGILPIAAAALLGVALMLVTGILTLNQAAKALDRQIFLMVAASLALGVAMLKTGAAALLADVVIGWTGTEGPAFVLSMVFLMVALFTNVLSNNATAILFTPISIGLATGLNTDPLPFVLAVLFGANCSFATPIGYQTNLLVMGPGYYRFSDFFRLGLPLVFILWAVFSFFMPWYYSVPWHM